MNDANVEFPTPTENDKNDVADAVTTANALWRQGDFAEAIRWLRRAAETAEEQGDDMRALALARAAAELRDNVASEQTAPMVAAEAGNGAQARAPSDVPAAPSESSAPPADQAASPSDAPRSLSDRPPPNQARSSSSFPPATSPSAIPAARMVSISKDGTATVRAMPVTHASAYPILRSTQAAETRRRSEPPSPYGRLEPPPGMRRSEPPPAETVRRSEPPPALQRSEAEGVYASDARASEVRAGGVQPPPAMERAEAPAAEAVRRSEPPPAAVQQPEAPAKRRSERPPAAKPVEPTTVRADATQAEPHSALRVSVEPSPDDRNLLLVRILVDGEQPAIGAREALLVPMESGVDLRFL